MNDLERIQDLEKKLRIKLTLVSLDELFTANHFLANAISPFSLSDIRNPKFIWNGVRNYSLDAQGNVNGLALDFCGLYVLEDNYLGDFSHLQKLKLRSSFQKDYSFLSKLKNLKELDISRNNISNVDFLKDLSNLTSLDLSFNRLSYADFLKNLSNLTSLNLSNNRFLNVDFLKDLSNLTSLVLSDNGFLHTDFLKDLSNLTSLNLSYNTLLNTGFIKDLPNLTSLDLIDTKLSNANFIKVLSNLTSLNLSRSQVANCEFLKDLSNLTSLDLSFNRLSNYEFLKDLSNLTSLDLSNNQLSNVDFLKDLSNLTSLTLSGNQLSNADFLKDLSNLTSLALSGNRLSNYEFLKDLSNLTSLALNHTGLSNADFPKDLSNLTSLALSATGLSNADFLKDLPNLTSLDLRNNRLSNMDILKDLFNLTSLDLSGTGLSNADFLKDLSNLTSLALRVNQLSNADFLKDLSNLTSLDLSHNRLSNLDVLKDLSNLTSLDLKDNPALPFAGEVLKDWEDAPKILGYIRDYYAGKTTGTNQSLNEGKIILIGQGNVGKTSLRKCLIEGACVEGQSKTEGLEVVKWNLNGLKDSPFDLSNIDAEKYKDVTMNIWDFGGQEIYHTTHQFFFNSRCLYILVGDFDEREEWKTNRIEYWLKTIEFLIRGEENESNDKTAPERNKPKTPVIIIGNKADKNRENTSPIDISKLEEKYPSIEIVKFIPISCTKGEKIGEVIETILGQLEKINVFTEIPAKYADARAKIQDDGRPFISQTEFGEFCAAEDAAQIRSILNDIGTIKAFGEDKKIESQKLKDLIVLKPNWITEGIYKILSANHLLDTQNGIATKTQIEEKLDKTDYPNIDAIIEMMEEFYICRQIPKEDKRGRRIDTYIFPGFFSVQRPQGYVSMMRESADNKIEFIYEYSLLSENVISFFIIEASKEKFDIKEFWREGAYLENATGDKALIEADSEDNRIRITTKAASRDLSERFFNDIKKIFAVVHSKEFIPSPTNEFQIDEAGQEIKGNSNLELSEERFKVLDEKLRVTEIKLEDAESQSSTIIEKLKSFIEELAEYRAKPKLNIFFLLFTSIPLLIIILAIYYGSIIAGVFGIAVIILQMYFSYKRRKEWSLLKAPEQIIQDEKSKIIEELGFNEKQQKLLK